MVWNIMKRNCLEVLLELGKAKDVAADWEGLPFANEPSRPPSSSLTDRKHLNIGVDTLALRSSSLSEGQPT